MENYTLERIKQRVFEWYQAKCYEVQENQECKLELTKNEKDVLLIEMSFKHCLATLAVFDPGWAPFKYVSFDANAVELEEGETRGTQEFNYFFYDSDDFKEQEVIDEIDFGFEYILNFQPGKLKKEYLNKKGTIQLIKKRIERVVHIGYVDKDKKITQNDLEGEFICQGVQFHYLIVSNGEITLRVVHTHFDVIDDNVRIASEQLNYDQLERRNFREIRRFAKEGEVRFLSPVEKRFWIEFHEWASKQLKEQLNVEVGQNDELHECLTSQLGYRDHQAHDRIQMLVISFVNNKFKQ